ncbi:hypothetical protein GXW82_23935 [Streptacidiphilus sp. 4-A2]|nr:hypothetical protein [Streptacidiphilus sp. 4-A2]
MAACRWPGRRPGAGGAAHPAQPGCPCPGQRVAASRGRPVRPAGRPGTADQADLVHALDACALSVAGQPAADCGWAADPGGAADPGHAAENRLRAHRPGAHCLGRRGADRAAAPGRGPVRGRSRPARGGRRRGGGRTGARPGPAAPRAPGTAGPRSGAADRRGPRRHRHRPALRGSLVGARYALASAAPYTDAARLDSLAALLAGIPAQVTAAFHERVLGALAAHDRENSVSLVATLAAFLEHDGSWSRTAKALHVHVNTVHYRARRIEQLTGRNLVRLSDQADLRAALLCAPGPGPGQD